MLSPVCRAHNCAAAGTCPKGRWLWTAVRLVFCSGSWVGSSWICSAHGPQARPVQTVAKIIVTPKRAVLDPQGKTIRNALEHMGYQGIQAVRMGKYLEIEITGDKETVRQQIDEACHRLLSNPVIEDYHFELE